MKKISLFSAAIFILGIWLITPGNSLAQATVEQIESSDIQMKMTPDTPGTNEKVTAELSSFLVDVNRLLITWFVGGEIVKSGYGETEITFTTGGQGEITSIEAYVQVDGSSAIRKWARVAPADLDILWEADTYTPPFYRGKALPTPESFITIVGIPNVRNEGSQALENNMVFNWEVNDSNLSSKSGFGKNPLVIRNDFLNLKELVNLEVIHKDGLTRASAEITIPISDPEVIVYERDTYLRRANYRGVNSTGNRLRFAAEPFFFSTKRELINILEFNWFMNGNIIEEQTSPRENELITTAPQSGIATEIGIQISHPSKPLQETPVLYFNVIQ